MSRSKPDDWTLLTPQTGPLTFSQASLKNRRNRAAVLALESGCWGTDAQLQRELSVMSYAIAAQVQETLVRADGATKQQARIVGAMWGDTMMLGERRLNDVLEIEAIYADAHYRQAVEEWMLDHARGQLHSKLWQHLVLRTPAKRPNHFGVALARRHGFRLADVKNGYYIWEWNPDRDDEA